MEEKNGFLGASTASGGQPTIKTPEKGGAKPPTTGKPTLNPYRISAHACTWRFKLDGNPKRGKYREVRLRNGLIVRYWKFNGVKIQSCRKTLFIYVKTGKKANSRQALYGAWNRADLARRAFSKWQMVGLEPEEAAHAAGATRAHIVVEAPKSLQEILTPIAPVNPAPPLAERVILRRDHSHSLKPEFENIDAGKGLDWLLLDLPQEWQELRANLALLEGENRATAKALNDLIMIISRGR